MTRNLLFAQPKEPRSIVVQDVPLLLRRQKRRGLDGLDSVSFIAFGSGPAIVHVRRHCKQSTAQ